MKVSFVIPTRNQSGFIRRCLDSCLSQEIDEREIIVMDGASTDGTQAILAQYGDRIRWRSQADSGQAEALNKGVAMATGDVIAWINSDDYYPHARVLPLVMSIFESDPSVDLVYGDGVMVDESGATLRRCASFAATDAHQVVVHKQPPMLQPAAFFSRALFLQVGGLDETLHFALDYDLWVRMWERARRIRRVADTLAYATYHQDAKSAYGLLPMVNELTRLKMHHGRRLGLGAREWIRLGTGVASLYVYYAAVRAGLWRAF